MSARVERSDSLTLADPRKRPLEQLVLNDEQGWRLARRIIASIELLHRRRQIDEWQHRDAARYRAAVEGLRRLDPLAPERRPHPRR